MLLNASGPGSERAKAGLGRKPASRNAIDGAVTAFQPVIAEKAPIGENRAFGGELLCDGDAAGAGTGEGQTFD